MSQVKFVNDAIDSARSGSPLYKLPHIRDPSDEIVAVHLAALKWNVLQRRFGLVASELAALQRSSVELLELLKSNLPIREGGKQGWNFEKAHSILHKVREIILHGWSENYSTQVCDLNIIYDIICDRISITLSFQCQGPEHCHIDFCKSLSRCINNKDTFLCVMRWHVRAGHLQYLHSLDTDAADNDGDFGGDDGPGNDVASKMRQDALPCELGIRYPNLQAILSGKRNIQTTLVLCNMLCSMLYNIIYLSPTGARVQDQGRSQGECSTSSLLWQRVLGHSSSETHPSVG